MTPVKDIIFSVLTGERIKLIPTENFDYFYELAMRDKYNTLSLVDCLDYRYLFLGGWVVYGDGIKGGAIAVAYANGLYSFDGYKDRELAKKTDNKYSFAYEAGKLALDYILAEITPVIYATPDVNNRAVITLDKRLGFTPVNRVKTEFGEFLIMEKQ